MASTKIVSTKIVTGKVRFSYAHVWEPNGFEGQEKKYSVSIVIPKSDTKTVNAIKAAIKAAVEAGKSTLSTNGKPVNMATLKTPLRDGDVERPDDPAYEGCYFINATSKRKPGIVDANVQPILDQSEFYSGCYGRASINFYAFNVSGNKGIAAGLNNLQKLEDGEPLAGGSTPEEDFSDFGSTDDLLG